MIVNQIILSDSWIQFQALSRNISDQFISNDVQRTVPVLLEHVIFFTVYFW